VTDDAFSNRYPVWMGRESRHVVYQSNQGGQLDLWETDVDGGGVRQLTSSDTEDRPGDVAADGTALTFEQRSERLWLWSVDPRSRTERQLTAEALTDFWPSVSRGSNVVVFQRSRPTSRLGFRFFDAQMRAGWADAARPNSGTARPTRSGTLRGPRVGTRQRPSLARPPSAAPLWPMPRRRPGTPGDRVACLPPGSSAERAAAGHARRHGGLNRARPVPSTPTV
jgi:hypothetical protein